MPKVTLTKKDFALIDKIVNEFVVPGEGFAYEIYQEQLGKRQCTRIEKLWRRLRELEKPQSDEVLK